MFSVATQPAPRADGSNEDYAIVSADGLVVVVDGAGVPSAGCVHSVSWYARHLGLATANALAGPPTITLADGLATAIETVNAAHADTCDLTQDATPCAAIGIARIGADTVDVLTLSDVTVALDTADGVATVVDLAIEELTEQEPVALAGLRFGTPEHQAALAHLVERQQATRNRDGGWWVAAARPEAAHHAKVATFERGCVRRLAVLSDGATRPVDQMGLYNWTQWMDRLAKIGPAELISHVREIETGDPDGARFPRTKRHDDATAVYVELPPGKKPE